MKIVPAFNLDSITGNCLLDEIETDVFENCGNLRKVALPNTVKRIGSKAFKGCALLSDINWPAALATIEDAAFEKCGSLPSPNLPNGLKSIGDDAFKGCLQITSIDLPVTVKEIGGSVFQDCAALTTIIINSGTPPSISSSTFKGTNASILIPKGARAVYSADKKWAKVNGLKENK